MFPTAAADYLEYERFYLVEAIKPFIEAGQLRAYSINSVNRYSLLNDQMPAPIEGGVANPLRSVHDRRSACR